MSLDLHTVSIKKGGTNPTDLSRLILCMLMGVAIPGPVGEATGAVIMTPGAGYTSLPTLAGADGSGGTFTASMAVATSVAAAAGATYAPNDTITLTGGTAAQQAILEVLTSKIVTAPAIAAAGTGYAPGDTVTGTGTGIAAAPVFNITHTQVVSATVAAGGTGGTNGTQTVTGTTGTGTPFQASVTIAGNAITAVLSISVAGDYTVNPTLITNEPVTGVSLVGAALSVVLGVKTVTIASGGSFTANNTSAGGITQASTSGVGTGATFTLTAAKYGVNTYAVQNAGSYTVLPSSPISQGSTSGSGTGFQLTASTWQLLSIAGSGGQAYKNGSIITATGGGGTTQATGQVVTNPIGEPITVNMALPLPPAGAMVQITPNGPCISAVNGKTVSGFNVTFYPRSSSEPVLATSFDGLLLH